LDDINRGYSKVIESGASEADISNDSFWGYLVLTMLSIVIRAGKVLAITSGWASRRISTSYTFISSFQTGIAKYGTVACSILPTAIFHVESNNKSLFTKTSARNILKPLGSGMKLEADAT
jgi:prolipoprotein diacylglyceryltransferase